MFTIGDLVKQFNLSRSTLIYYDKIDLHKPSGRTDSNYRLYTQDDVNRLEKITIYKNAGLSLEEIKQLLASSETQTTLILQQRLQQLNQEISLLRSQQQLVVQLLGQDSLLRHMKVVTKEQWVALLESSGMDQMARQKWHEEFERTMPEAHTDFLESLGITPEEVAAIKKRSQQ